MIFPSACPLEESWCAFFTCVNGSTVATRAFNFPLSTKRLISASWSDFAIIITIATVTPNSFAFSADGGLTVLTRTPARFSV